MKLTRRKFAFAFGLITTITIASASAWAGENKKPVALVIQDNSRYALA
jgi:hypothetical protein